MKAEKPVPFGLGRGDLVLLVLNTVVGAGVVALPGRAYAAAGRDVFLALGLAACVAGVIALAFARLAARFPGPGGPYLYARATLGPAAGFAVAACLVPTRLLATAASLVILMEALQLWMGEPQARLLVLTVAVVCTLVALRSVTTPIRAGNLLGAVKLGLLVAIALGGLWAASSSVGIRLDAPPGAGGLGPAVLLWFYAFSGFESPTILAAESRNGRRDLPLALISGILLSGALYAALMISSLKHTPDLATSTSPLADAAAAFMPPLVASGVSVGLALLILASLPSQFTIAPRLLASVAGDARTLTPLRARPNGVSPPAILTCALLVLAMTQLQVQTLVALSALVRLGSYALCSFGLAVSGGGSADPAGRDRWLGVAAVAGALIIITLAGL